jgi:hypothetical protein
MMVDTLLGPIPAHELVLSQTRQEIPCGELLTTTYTLNGRVVKQDQHVTVSEENMPSLDGTARI